MPGANTKYGLSKSISLYIFFATKEPTIYRMLLIKIKTYRQKCVSKVKNFFFFYFFLVWLELGYLRRIVLEPPNSGCLSLCIGAGSHACSSLCLKLCLRSAGKQEQANLCSSAFTMKFHKHAAVLHL